MTEIVKRLPDFQEPDKLEKAKILINQLGKNLHEHAYICGRLLIWVQSTLESKEIFEAWIANNIWFGLRTVRYFIAHAKKCDRAGLLLDYHPAKQIPSDATIAPISGNYKTIIIDPPWPIEKIERYEAPFQEPNIDYKTMTIEAIQNSEYPFSGNCHVFLWTTQKFLPISFEILKAWELKYIFTMVWYKEGGFQPFELPQYNCEFVVYGRRGSPKFLEIKNFFTCFYGKRREHSRKPKEFYDTIRRVCPEPRINIFTREPIEGFESWGDESDKF